MENLEKKLGNVNAKAVRLGEVNKETKFILDYLGMDAPELVSEIPDNQEVILVDHNDPVQSVDNIGNAKVLKEIDFAGLIGTIIMLFRNETIKRKIKREFILREYERTVLGDSYNPAESFLLNP